MGEIVNHPYRPCSYGDSSQAIFRHCTRFFRGRCEHARCVDVFVMDENASKSGKSRSQNWLFPAISKPFWNFYSSSTLVWCFEKYTDIWLHKF